MHTFTFALAEQAREHQPELDELIRRYANDWPLERIAPLERSILRVALLEMLYPEVVPGEQPIPPEGAIDEAIETAKRFCGSGAPAFINGILGAVLRERTEAPARRKRNVGVAHARRSTGDNHTMRLLVVDDDRGLRDVLRRALTLSGYEVVLAATGSEALSEVTTSVPDAVVLDVGLPDIDGLEVCRLLRREGNRVPVLMLTARDAVSDRIDGLDAGADDYLVKPFDVDELRARLRALLRRAGGEGDVEGGLTFAELRLDPARHGVEVAGTFVELTRTEYQLLELLMLNPRRVLPHSRSMTGCGAMTSGPPPTPCASMWATCAASSRTPARGRSSTPCGGWATRCGSRAWMSLRSRAWGWPPGAAVAMAVIAVAVAAYAGTSSELHGPARPVAAEPDRQHHGATPGAVEWRAARRRPPGGPQGGGRGQGAPGQRAASATRDEGLGLDADNGPGVRRRAGGGDACPPRRLRVCPAGRDVPRSR